MSKLQKLFFIIFIVVVAAYFVTVAYMMIPEVKGFIDGTGVANLAGGTVRGIGEGITTNSTWTTYIGPNANLIILAIGGIIGVIGYRYIYEKGIREKAIRDAWDSRGGASSGILTGPTTQTPTSATTRPPTTQPAVVPQPAVPAVPPEEEKK